MISTSVDARIKKSSWIRFEDTRYFPLLCGRHTGAGSYDCGGDLGRIWRYTALKDGDLTDSRSWSGGVPNFTDWTSVAVASLIELATDLRGCHVGETSDGKRYQIWLAEHELGYRRLPSGQYEVLRRRSPVRESERLVRTPRPTGIGEGYIERSVGRKPLPKDVAELVRSRGGARDGTPLGLAADGQGVVGEVPPIPSVIICPKCGARNRVLPLVFDERRGGWYSVDPG